MHLSTSACIALAWPIVPGRSLASPPDLNEAINIAGRQRMLSQRMLKAWLAWGQEIEPSKAERALAQSVSMFDKQLSELANTAFDSSITATLSQLDGHWKDLKTALTQQPPDRGRAAALLSLEDNVLQSAQQATTQIERLAGKPLGKVINLAGRQRMLSQRAAKFYLASAWGVDGGMAQAEISKARGEFSAALQTLRSASESTVAIRAELDIASQQWVILDNALTHRTNDVQSARHAAEVFVASENILSQMERITGLYAKSKAA